MSRAIQSRAFFAAVCALLALAVGMSLVSGWGLPGFGSGILPPFGLVEVSQSPFPPPDPGPVGEELKIAQSPFPPPDPGPVGEELRIAQSPFPPPDPGPVGEELRIAQSPFPPPDPGPVGEGATAAPSRHRA